MKEKEKRNYAPETEDSEDETIFEKGVGLSRVYDYMPYTYHRIVRVFETSLGWKLENIYQDYKANRRFGYQELYRVVDINTADIYTDQEKASYEEFEASGCTFSLTINALNENGNTHRSSMDYRLRKYCRMAGISKRSTHKIRRRKPLKRLFQENTDYIKSVITF